MNNHTPGPWKLRDHHDIAFHGRYLGNIVTESGALITDGYVLADSYQEAQANGKLLAAAPELLEVCKRLIKVYSEAESSDEFEVQGQARDAIQKAEGK